MLKPMEQWQAQDAGIMFRAMRSWFARTLFAVFAIWWALVAGFVGGCSWWVAVLCGLVFSGGFLVLVCMAPASILRCWAGFHPQHVKGWRQVMFYRSQETGKVKTFWKCPTCGAVTDRRRDLSILWEAGRRG